MKQDFLKKLYREEALTPEEVTILDRALESQVGGVRACVSELSDEVPSLAWRATLQARLLGAETAPDLALPEQIEAASWVKGLPEPMPSDAWRASLNAKLAGLRPAGFTAEKVDLEVGLAAMDAQPVAVLVRSLPEETPPMTWRSQLNERLHRLRPAKRRLAWLSLRWAGAGAALAGACALTVIMLGRGPDRPIEGTVTSVDPVEARLVAAHQESAGALDLGANTRVQIADAQQPTSPSYWNDRDLDTL